VRLPVRSESPPRRTGSPEGRLLALLVGEARAGIRLVREHGQARAVRAVDAVAERYLLAHERAGYRLFGDVDDVVAEAPTVRPALEVPAEDAEPAELVRLGDGDRQLTLSMSASVGPV
jgi:hypothetical protein